MFACTGTDAGGVQGCIEPTSYYTGHVSDKGVDFLGGVTNRSSQRAGKSCSNRSVWF